MAENTTLESTTRRTVSTVVCDDDEVEPEDSAGVRASEHGISGTDEVGDDGPPFACRSTVLAARTSETVNGVGGRA